MIRIGILTFCHPVNYGAYLQSFALCNRLNQESDICAEIIDYKMTVEDKYYRGFLKIRKNVFRTVFSIRRYVNFQKAWKDMPAGKEVIRTDELDKVRSALYGKYDIIITGSDEVWKVDGMRGFPTPFFLPGDYGAIKVAYAVSGRTSFSYLKEEDLKLLEECINDYEYIGVRDRKTFQEVKNHLTNFRKVHLNYDPTLVYSFSLNRDLGKKILKEKFHVDTSVPCIGIMFYEERGNSPNLLKTIKKIVKDKAQIIALYDWEPGVVNNASLSPLEWVQVITALDGVVTMYFHAVCFSIIAGTPFMAIEVRAKDNNESKLFDLVEQFGVNDRYSLGLKDAIESGELEIKVNEMILQKRMNFTKKIEKIRDEFNEFTKELRVIFERA